MSEQPPKRDSLGRTPIADAMKAQIADAFSVVPKGKRGALLVIVDDRGVARGHLAAKLGDHWKVAGGGGFSFTEKRPFGFVGVEGAW